MIVDATAPGIVRKPVTTFRNTITPASGVIALTLVANGANIQEWQSAALVPLVTISATGVTSHGEAIAFINNGSGGTHRIWRSAGAGLVLQGGTGSAYDFSVLNAAGSYLFRNPTGTQTVDFIGPVTMASTLAVTGLSTLTGGALFNGNQSSAQGKIHKAAVEGLTIRGITGSTNDLTIYSADGGTLIGNPTGTRNLTVGHSSGTVTMPGAVSMSSTLAVTGTITGSGNWLYTQTDHQVLATTNTQRITISGGSTTSSSTGASILLAGVSHANTGLLQLNSGAVSGAAVNILTGGTTRMSIPWSGNITMTPAGGTFTLTGAQTISSTLVVTGNTTVNGNLWGSKLAAVGPYGIFPDVQLMVSSDATSGISGTGLVGIRMDMNVLSTASGDSYGGQFNVTTVGGTFSVNALHGVYISVDRGSAGVTVGTAYGLRIANVSIPGATNYAIYTNAGTVRLGGAVTMASTLDVTGNFTGSGDWIFTQTTHRIRANSGTNKRIIISAGSTGSQSEGGVISIGGITSSDIGNIVIAAGQSTGSVQLFTTTTTGVVVNANGTINMGGATTFDADIITTLTTAFVRSNSNDGTDNKRLIVTGGGGQGGSRGANIAFFGNEFGGGADGGLMSIEAGNVSTGRLEFYTAGSLRGTWNNSGQLFLRAANTVSEFDLIVQGSRGTVSSPSDVANGDTLLAFSTQGYSAGFFAMGQINFVVDGTFTSGQRPPSKIEFYTNQANAAQTLRMSLTNNGTAIFTGNVVPSVDIVFTGSSTTIRTDTSDASDTKALNLTGGGAVGTGRGAYIQLFGNEFGGSSNGRMTLSAGNASPGDIVMATGAAPTIRLQISNTGTVTISNLGGGGARYVKTDNNGLLTGSTTLLHNDSTGQVTATASGANQNAGFIIEAAIPFVAFHETGVAADQGWWAIGADASRFKLVAFNDAFSTVNDVITVDRSGATVTSIRLVATTSTIEQLLLAAGTTARASLRLPVGVAPTTPVDGDIWRDNTTDRILIQIGANTRRIQVVA